MKPSFRILGSSQDAPGLGAAPLSDTHAIDSAAKTFNEAFSFGEHASTVTSTILTQYPITAFPISGKGSFLVTSIGSGTLLPAGPSVVIYSNFEPAAAVRASTDSRLGDPLPSLRRQIANELHQRFSRAVPAIGLAALMAYANVAHAESKYSSPQPIQAWIDRSSDATWAPDISGSTLEPVTVSTAPAEARAPAGQQSDRATLARNIIEKIERWALIESNWDNEGAAAPIISSLKEAATFVNLLGKNYLLPEPMLLASGHASLYWNEAGLYADLEFLGDGRVAYFVEHRGKGRHKGVVILDSRKMPSVFQALLRHQEVV